MGQHFVDQYTLLHFATGVIGYFWGISFLVAILLHMTFEWIENTKEGMGLINKLPFWPGGKDKADSPLNSFGDTLFFGVGWLVSYAADFYGSKKGWYPQHLPF